MSSVLVLKYVCVQKAVGGFIAIVISESWCCGLFFLFDNAVHYHFSTVSSTVSRIIARAGECISVGRVLT